MISIIVVLIMAFETTFMDAQAKYRSNLDATTHRKIESSYNRNTGAHK